jgi:hypothetical protein
LRKRSDRGEGKHDSRRRPNDAGETRRESLGLRGIAELGRGGYSAGPALVGLLDSDDWLVRVAAARTLGIIGYRDSITRLRKVLQEPQDWRLIWVTARSLWQLKAKEAVVDLRAVSRNHWYPSVREMADRAADAIASQHWLPEPEPTPNMSIDFYDWLSVAQRNEPCATVEVANGDEVLTVSLSGFDRQPGGDTLPEGVFSSTDSTDERAINNPELGMGRVVALQVVGGWLAGQNRGEWGGQLVFVEPEGPSQLLLNKNVFAIYRLVTGVYVVAAAEISAFGEAAIYRAASSPDGRWTVEPVAILPRWLTASAVVGTESIVVAAKGGTVLFNGSEDLTMLECVDHGTADAAPGVR